jgi:transcriptional regulator with XRE-family HTH domain
MVTRGEWLRASGERLRGWREHAGLRQSEAASKAGMPQSKWSLLEAGATRPNVEQALAIVALTGNAIALESWVPPAKRGAKRVAPTKRNKRRSRALAARSTST